MKAYDSVNKKIGRPGITLHTDNGNGSRSWTVPATKSELLAGLFNRPGTFEQIDSAWRLAMWLMMAQNGVVVGTYEDIAGQLHSNKSTVKNWADALVARGVAERKPKGKQVEIGLVGEYLRVATAPNEVCIEDPAVPAVTQMSPQVLSLIQLSESAHNLGGQISITITGCNLGGEK